MESQPQQQRKTRYKSKKQQLEEMEPFEITQIHLAQECYIDKETLRSFNSRVFTGTFKTTEETAWTVSILPDNLQMLVRHQDVVTIYSKVALVPYLPLPPWGMDVKRAYQMLSSLTEEGTATIDDRDGMLVEVNITEELVSEALKIPRGNVSLMSRNTPEESNATFLLARTQDYTFKDLLHKEVELPLRIFTQHFTHGKEVRYTRPHRRVVAFFTMALTGNRKIWSLNFIELILTELKAFAKEKKAPNTMHMNCGLALTRLAYFAVGMIDELPPAGSMEEWTVKSQFLAARTVRAPKGKGVYTRRTARAIKQAQE
ncbi:hypothetical protein GOP47_0006635 [Adiantum capillus-veneris]|uniref:Uncharacterized protein n=1 Tax=Adiantum capillus-veneris TaxID=13818 RepID=A0A9D4V3N2_ADICA|nr:hypothetical protein GOP47_0006635 [Adiantum capillus-veneris]